MKARLVGIGAAVPALLVVALVGAAPASAAVSCTYQSASATARVTLTEGATAGTVSRDAAGVIRANGVACGLATVTNTDTVAVVGDGRTQTLSVDLTGGFGPGKTAELTGVSEIEFTVNLGAEGDVLRVLGSNGPDTVLFGSLGGNLNGDNDADDLRWAGVGTFVLVGRDGADALSAAGSALTGQPLLGKDVQAYGGAGDDSLTGGGFRNKLYGDADSSSGTPVGAGNDVLVGNAWGDDLFGHGGNDRISGGGAIDRIFGGPGNDVEDGGTGADEFDFGISSAPDGADVIAGGPGEDTLPLRARTAPMRITLDGLANDGADTSVPADGVADEGDNVGADVETFFLGSGNDYFNANTTRANATSAQRTVFAGAGNDYVELGNGDHSVAVGDSGNDQLYGGLSDNNLAGNAGNDVLFGRDGADLLTPADGADQSYGEAGDDTISADALADGVDVYGGGSGVDVLRRSAASHNLFMTLDNVANDGADADANGVAEERDNVRADIERLVSGSGNDVLLADTAAANTTALDNDFDGGGGNDTLRGGEGEDTLKGVSGNDTIDGGAGGDELNGGPGADALHARDGWNDLVDGGADGGDTAEVDAIDFVRNVEAPTVAATATASPLAVACSFDAGSATARVDATGITTLTIARAAGGQIQVNGANCGAATVTNTNTIKVFGDGAGQTVNVDVTGGLGPGLTPEATGSSEIELLINLGMAPTEVNNLGLVGSGAADNIQLGSKGANLNGDDDVDVRSAGVDEYALTGRAGDDSLKATGGLTGQPLARRVRIFGGDGNDSLAGGAGTDTIYGDADGSSGTPAGAGNDIIAGNAQVDTLHGQGGNDQISGGDNLDRIVGGPGNDVENGGAGGDQFDGGAGPDGADVISGGPGADIIEFKTRSQPIRVTLDNVANDGADTSVPADGVADEGDNIKADIEIFTMGPGNDYLQANTAAANAAGAQKTVEGGAGNDFISVGNGAANQLTGGPGNDEIRGGSEEDDIGRLEASAADLAGDDVLRGGGEDDTIRPGDGADQVFGEAGDDTILARQNTADGADRYSGGSGDDSFDRGFGVTANLVVRLDNIANDGVDANGDGTAEELDNVQGDLEYVETGSGNDILAADTGLANSTGFQNVLIAGAGNDTLRGGTADDILSGDQGNDTLTGGAAGDALFGDAGADTLFARDGWSDLVDAGADGDTAQFDATLDQVFGLP
jgi:Ca2+-binding RTX toxin-like protein